MLPGEFLSNSAPEKTLWRIQNAPTEISHLRAGNEAFTPHLLSIRFARKPKGASRFNRPAGGLDINVRSQTAADHRLTNMPSGCFPCGRRMIRIAFIRIWPAPDVYT